MSVFAESRRVNECRTKIFTFRRLNMKNNNFYKSTAVRFLGSIFFLIAIFALASSAAQAQIVYTTVAASDPENASAQALVTVFDAQSGRQIANGMTDLETGQFRFAAYAEQSFVIAAITESGYAGSGRGAAGTTISISANQSEMSIPSVCYDNAANPILLGYQNASGAALKNARVSIVDRYRFINARRGKTNQQGQYSFKIPNDMQGLAFLAVVWKGDGAIKLSRVTVGCGF
jgi:hypothetical protein